MKIGSLQRKRRSVGSPTSASESSTTMSNNSDLI